MPTGRTNSPTSPLHTNKTFVQVNLLQESDLQQGKPKRAPQLTYLQDITNKNRHCMKSPTPEKQCNEGIFQIQYPICAINFTNKISRSSWPWHNLWKLLTFSFKNKYFHNSVDWSGFYLQVYIPSWLAKILRFIVFRLLENAFARLPCLYHDLIINAPCKTATQ